MNIATLLLTVSVFIMLSGCGSTPLLTDQKDDSPYLSTQYADTQTGARSPAQINTELGAGYINNGRYDRAMLKLKKALKQDPEYTLAHNYIAILYSRLGQPDLAYKHFQRAIELDPYNSSVRNNYGVFLCEQEKFSEAEEQLKKAYSNPLYIGRARTYQSAGWCAYLENDYARAEEYYRQALQLDSGLARSVLGLARINYKQTNYPLSWHYFKQFDKLSTQFADSLWLGINILRKLEEPDLNLMASYELQLENRFPDSEEARMFFMGKQDY